MKRRTCGFDKPLQIVILSAAKDLRFCFQLHSVMAGKDHHYYVYLVASRSHTLYCGVTNCIQRRVQEHRDGLFAGFSAKYRCNRLVWFEHYQYVNNAIDREKQIKGWVRRRKIDLIEAGNPAWVDLSKAWRLETAGPSFHSG